MEVTTHIVKSQTMLFLKNLAGKFYIPEMKLPAWVRVMTSLVYKG